MEVQDLLDLARGLPPAVVWAVLAVGAFVEHVFPPFPGDAVVLAGAVLVGAYGWHVAPVWIAVTVGALIGGAVDLWAGRWLAQRHAERLGPRSKRALDEIVRLMKRYGAVVIALNRFVPGVRALFFVAAGLADLKPAAVMGWATVSVVLWNTLLVAGGIALGQNFDQLVQLVARYQGIAWIAVGLLVIGVGIRIVNVIRG
jgi:membrane protein DedA with SNARE-associated domain